MQLQSTQSAKKAPPPTIGNTASDSYDGASLTLTGARNSNDDSAPSTDNNVDESVEAATDSSANEQGTTANENRLKGG